MVKYKMGKAIFLKKWVLSDISWSHVKDFWSFTKQQIRYHLPIWFSSSVKTLMANLELLSSKWPPRPAPCLLRYARQEECWDSIATALKNWLIVGPHSWPYQLKISWETWIVLCDNPMLCSLCCIYLPCVKNEEEVRQQFGCLVTSFSVPWLLRTMWRSSQLLLCKW